MRISSLSGRRKVRILCGGRDDLLPVREGDVILVELAAIDVLRRQQVVLKRVLKILAELVSALHHPQRSSLKVIRRTLSSAR